MPPNNLPYNNDLSVDILAGIFKDTTNSYKLYWFYAVIQIVKKEAKQEISIDEIIAKMIASAWYTINYFHISFGKLDQLAKVVNTIREETELEENANVEVVQTKILNALKTSQKVRKDFNPLKRYVPYRLLSPFFRNELRGQKDKDKNQIITDLSRGALASNIAPVYSFSDDNKRIIIHSVWLEYLRKNIALVESFCLWNLVAFLQKRNPNLPNIGEKLFAPPANRDLSKAHKFWNIVFEDHAVESIYTKQALRKENISIDHFVPWSYVTHDLLWNLVPVEKAVNSSKGNNLPDMDRYFQGFAKLQYLAVQTVASKRTNLLEDYSMLFRENTNEITRMNEQTFSKRLYQEVAPLVQIAANAGFGSGWTFSTHKLRD